MDRVVLAKARSIERCAERARTVYGGDREGFLANVDRQDIVVLNLIRACEQAIDLANRMIRLRRLGVADDAREAFALLGRAGLLEQPLVAKLQRMVGFRNVAVHEYQALDMERVVHVVEQGLDDLLAFGAAMLRAEA